MVMHTPIPLTNSFFAIVQAAQLAHTQGRRVSLKDVL